MRMGAIFARGSCRALRWMALFGVVFALGAGQAFAQGPEIGIKSVTVGGRTTNTVPEGQLMTVTVTLTERVPRTATGINTVVVTLAEGILGTDGAYEPAPAAGTAAEEGWAEHEDVAIPNVAITIGEQANSGSASFVTGRDADAVDEKFRIRAVPAVGTGSVAQQAEAGHFTVDTDAGFFAGKIDDAEEQDYKLELDTAVTANKPKEGDTFDMTVRADPSRPANETVQVFMYMDTGSVTGYTYRNPTDSTAITNVHSVYLGSGGDQTIDEGALIADLRVMAPPNDKNRTDDTIQVQAFVGSAGRNDGVATLDVVVADVQMLPDADAIEAEARDEEKYADGMTITSVEEGGTAYVFVTVTNTRRDQVADDEKFSVSLSAANSAQQLDFKVTPSSITVPSRDDFTLPSDDSERVGPFTLEALMDADIGAETLMLNIDLTTAEPTKNYGAGTSGGTFSIDLVDTTTPTVSVKDGAYEAIMDGLGDDPLNPGDSVQIMTSDMFMFDPAAVTVAFGTSVEGAAASASASGEMVMITAQSVGEAKITVTATATPRASSFIPSQTVSNVAQITFPVTVEKASFDVVGFWTESEELMEGGDGTQLMLRLSAAPSEIVRVLFDVFGDEDAYALRWEDGNDASASFHVDPMYLQGDDLIVYGPLLYGLEDDDYDDESLSLRLSEVRNEDDEPVQTGSGSVAGFRTDVKVIDNDEAPVDEPTVVAKSPADVQAIFDREVPSGWAEGDDPLTFNVGQLFEPFGPDVDAVMAATSSNDAVVMASVTGHDVTLSAMSEGEATISVTASDRASGDSDTASGMVTVADLPLSVGVSAPAMVAEGGSIMITATANKMVDTDVMVMLTRDGASTAGADDYTVGELMIPMGEMTGTAMLMATDDYDVEGNESLTLNAMVGDMSAGMVMVTIEDNDAETTYMLSADPTMVMEGGTSTITATASQMVRANTEVMVMRDASSTAGADDYSVSVPLITIMMGETTGSLTLTATDDLDVEGDESLTLNGMVDDMNAGSVMVTINDNDVDSAFTLSGPADMNLVEGESYELTVMADPAVTMDTTVTITRDRSMSDADDADYTVEPVTIMAGESMGTTMLMVTEDSMDDAGSGMPEMLVVFGMVDGMETNSLTFYTWDMAVPALPLIAQLLLAAFLAIGGYRRYLRR